MRQPAINFSIDTVAFLVFVFLVSTGTLIYWVLPAGSGSSSIWGMTCHDWGETHFWIAIGFVALIATHFILHWGWIKSLIMGKAHKVRRGDHLTDDCRDYGSPSYLLEIELTLGVLSVLSIIHFWQPEWRVSFNQIRLWGSEIIFNRYFLIGK